MTAEVRLARGESELGAPVIAELEPTLLAVPLAAGTSELITMAGHASLWIEDYDRAGRLIDRVVRDARAANALGILAYPLATRAHLDFRLGRWADALADAEAAVETADLSAQTGMLAHALAALALVQAGLGQREAARTSGQRSLELARRFDARALMLYAHHALGLEALGAGRPQDAIDDLAQCAAIVADDYEPGLVQWQADHVEAFVRAGQHDGARRALARLEADAARTGRSWALAAAARCRGLMAGDDSFEAELRGAVTLHERSDQPFERARTELVLGERLRRARRLADAREPLRSALAAFERLGARDWASRARDELRTAGATTGEAPAVRRGFDELTAHELRIALLAARGGPTRRSPPTSCSAARRSSTTSARSTASSACAPARSSRRTSRAPRAAGSRPDGLRAARKAHRPARNHVRAGRVIRPRGRRAGYRSQTSSKMTMMRTRTPPPMYMTPGNLR